MIGPDGREWPDYNPGDPQPGARPVIISHRHRFIFLHCRKTAGSSISQALAPYLGEDDLYLGTWPEALEAGVAPNRRARRDLRHPRVAADYIVRLARRPHRIFRQSHRVDALNGAQRKKYRQRLGPSPEHARAADVRDFDPDAWRDYFKFCFVRNPWERAVSDWQWRTRKRDIQIGFLEYLEHLARAEPGDRLIPRQIDNWPIYTIDDAVAVDAVGRFENLTEDFREICTRIGLDEVPELPHAKAGESGPHWRTHYGPAESALVQRLFAREIEHFQYLFD